MIPPALAGRDVVGIAATGTGKTAAFALPILHQLAGSGPRVGPGPRALVLCPTRELAAQTAENFRSYGRNLGTRVALIVGGVAWSPQVDALTRGVDVVVATPGRLIDHLRQRTARLGDVKYLVLDEVDHMLEVGFLPAVLQLVERLPAVRQNLFFSATMPPNIEDLARKLLTEPERVMVTPSATPAERIDQRVVMIEQTEKLPLLEAILGRNDHQRTLVFTRTKRGADRVANSLAKRNIEAVAIHGDRSQKQRERALAMFRNGRTPVLIATDIAARGVDVEGIGLVINYDMPDVAETYVHRIGRTGRAGASGTAVSFCGHAERPTLRAIEALIRRKLPYERHGGPGAAGITAAATAAPPVEREPEVVAHPVRRPMADKAGHAPRSSGERDRGPGSERPSRSTTSPRGDSRRRGPSPHHRPPVADTGDLSQIAVFQPARRAGTQS